MATEKVYTALTLLAFIGVVCLSSAHAHTPTPPPAPVHKPIVVRECNDVCKDKCFQDIQRKCIDVPYQEQVCIQTPFIDHKKHCEKVCVEPTGGKGYQHYGKKGLRRLAQAYASAAAAAAAAGPYFGGFDQGKGYQVPVSGKGHVPIHVPAPICHEECFDVPITKFKPECKTVTKHRQECKDLITNICKKECVPVCRDIVPVGAKKGLH